MLFVFSGLFSLAASLPLKCTTTSFPTDLTGKSCDGLQPAGPAANAAACAAICCAQGEAACSTWNFKHAGGGFPAQCYIGMATHCDQTLSPKYDGGQRGVPAIPPLAPCPWSGGKFCSMGASAPSKFDYIYPPGDVAAVMYGKAQDRLHLFGGSGGGGGSKGNIVFNGTTWFTSGSLDDLEYARDGSHCAASNDADSDVKMAIVVGGSGARRRALGPGSHCGKPPCPPVPDHQKTWEAYSYADDPTFGHSYYHTSGQDLPGPRSDAVCIGLKEKVYVLGGKLHYGNDSSANVFAFTPSGTQGDVVISSAAAMPTDVSPACAAVLNGRIYAVGGTDHATMRAVRTVSSFDGSGWRAEPSTPLPFIGGVCVAHGGVLYAWGQSSDGGERRAVVYTFDGTAWTDATATTPTPTTASGTHTEPLGPSRQSYVVNGSRLYLFFSSMDPDDPTALPVDMSQYIDLEGRGSSDAEEGAVTRAA